MANVQELTLKTADGIANVANDAVLLLWQLQQVLEFNSDLAIDWVPPTKTFTAANGTDTYTATAHGLLNGQKARVTNSGGALPVPLLINTDYFLIAVAANTFQLSATLGGAAINITTDGTGTHTLHPVPAYIAEDVNGNISNRTFSRADVSNAIGSLDWIRKLLTNQVMTGSQGDHLGNLNKLSSPLG